MSTTLYKVIFRLDYKICYSILDRSGSVLKYLNTLNDLELKDSKSESKDFWDGFGDSPDPKALSALFTDQQDKHYRGMSVGPKAIYGTLEWADGIDFESLHDSYAFNKMMHLVDQLRAKFSIDKLARCGMRFIVCDGVGSEDSSGVELLENVWGTKYKNLVSHLNAVSDTQMCIEGISSEAESKSDFRASFGPYAPKDLTTRFEVFGKEIDKEAMLHKHIITCDIDIFAKNVNMLNTDMIRWSRIKIDQCKQFVTKLKTTIGN